MRVRQGNPHAEAHGTTKRVHDWIAPSGTVPGDIPAAIAAAVPGLKLAHTGDGEVNGAVYTSLRPDGSLYVCVELYDHDCADPACEAGHGAVAHRRAPQLSPSHHAAMKHAVGEHSVHRLGVGQDEAVLRRLGFTEHDSPLRSD